VSPAPLAQTGRLQRPDALRVQGAQAAGIRWLRGDAPEKHFPAAARAQALDGIVTVDLLINADGFVQEAQVISESPPAAGFGLAALDTVKTYVYENPLRRPVLLTVSVSFLP
jgi:TonB family protein